MSQSNTSFSFYDLAIGLDNATRPTDVGSVLELTPTSLYQKVARIDGLLQIDVTSYYSPKTRVPCCQRNGSGGSASALLFHSPSRPVGHSLAVPLYCTESLPSHPAQGVYFALRSVLRTKLLEESRQLVQRSTFFCVEVPLFLAHEIFID